jgi:protocatechuate 3,4-dioxygenase alpha subunit
MRKIAPGICKGHSMASQITTSQTVGPFPHEAWAWAVNATATVASTAKTVTISGTIYDGDGTPISDAWIEAWTPHGAAAEQASPMPGFRRIPSNDNGGFTATVSLSDKAAAGEPVMYVTVFARGLIKHQFTAVFLDDDSSLQQSAILHQVPVERRDTLIAKKQSDGHYQWDIWMQTVKETVFFDYT